MGAIGLLQHLLLQGLTLYLTWSLLAILVVALG
jgi:hypothetical protein